ncbi:hypothetical protein [Prauserella cavernicola]|nr:hypothetical protein [Prauserella cavernicola]
MTEKPSKPSFLSKLRALWTRFLAWLATPVDDQDDPEDRAW